MIIERNYLLKVLGLSGIPKLVTFALTLISFPLLVRALGPETYGSVLFIGAALSLFEVLIDFGVSTAAGKSMAAVRAYQPAAIYSEFFAWAKLQASFVTLGFLPMLVAAYLIVEDSPTFRDPNLLLVMAVSVVFSVILNFIRPNLQSLLAFKSLAVLDTAESIIRSSGILLVAFFFPSALGLAYAGLATAILACLLAIGLITMRLSVAQSQHTKTWQEAIPQWPGRHTTVKSRLRESASFLWLRLSTRVFQEGPLIIIGRLVGPDLVGVIGALRKLLEILSTPYLVIGNALMVRANEVVRCGHEASRAIWITSMRIVSTSLFLTVMVFLLSEPLAHLLLPLSSTAPTYVEILSIMLFSTVVGSVFAPISDYLGGLLVRSILLTVMAIIQLFVVWLLAQYFNETAILIGLVAIHGLMVFGYVLIASKTMLGSCGLFIDNILKQFIAILITGLFVIKLIAYYIEDFSCAWGGLVMPLTFFLIILVTVSFLKKTRDYFFNPRFLEIDG